MSKQTAVEWLQEQFDNSDDDFITIEEFNQAKEMEKQQLIDFTDKFISQHTSGDYDGEVQKSISVEQYYEQTFNK
jgi:hypothetical protein